MINKALVITGATSTGKTSLALDLAKKFRGELISADSRQVYKHMNLLTGKDIPIKTKFISEKKSWQKEINRMFDEDFQIGKYVIDNIAVWGLDLVESGKKFSLAQWLYFAGKIMTDLWKENKLPLIVGGTGMWINALVRGIDTVGIPQDFRLRKKLSKKDTKELFAIYTKKAPDRAKNLNSSEKNNPHRLIRAIEIAMSDKKFPIQPEIQKDTLVIGLTAPKELIEQKIQKRLLKRYRKGVLKELKYLQSKYDLSSMSFCGKDALLELADGKIDKKTSLKKWFFEENKYAKAQNVWFKKYGRDYTWFDISQKDWNGRVVAKVKNWYYKENETKN